MLRAYRRHIVEAMLHCHERSTFIPILANTFARRTTEIDVRHAEREFGDSKYSLMKLINLMYDLITQPDHRPAAFAQCGRQHRGVVRVCVGAGADCAASAARP